MERVLGIGGFFFTANDPEQLSQWYLDHLGINPIPMSYEAEVWTQQAGPTVFGPFGADQADNPYLGAAGWGINFRVADLDSFCGQLQRGGISVDVDETVYPNGRFASLSDPEGNAIQLWEPA
ncbi:MAG: VOC family protein [Acidimicrobiales bacterium]